MEIIHGKFSKSPWIYNELLVKHENDKKKTDTNDNRYNDISSSRRIHFSKLNIYYGHHKKDS